MIGCGFYAQNHLHAWAELRALGTELVAVCDLDPEKAKAAGDKFGAKWYTDVDQMLNSTTIDLIDIATQMGSHQALAALAAERKIASILQKPLAPTLDECVAIVDLAQKQKVWLAVHENFRFGTGMRRVKETIASGVIGAPNWARISFRTCYDVYAGQPYQRAKIGSPFSIRVFTYSTLRAFSWAKWTVFPVKPSSEKQVSRVRTPQPCFYAISLVLFRWSRLPIKRNVNRMSFPKLCWR